MSKPQRHARVSHATCCLQHVLHCLAHAELAPSRNLEQRPSVGTCARDVDTSVVVVALKQTSCSRERSLSLLLGKSRVHINETQGVTQTQRVSQTHPFLQVAIIYKVLVVLICSLVCLVAVKRSRCLCQLLKHSCIDVLLAVILSIAATCCSLRVGYIAKHICRHGCARSGIYAHGLVDVVISR